MKLFKVVCVKGIDKYLKINKEYYAQKHFNDLLDIYDINNKYIGRFKKYLFKTLKKIRIERLHQLI